jgi:hypothetical protein
MNGLAPPVIKNKDRLQVYYEPEGGLIVYFAAIAIHLS